LLNKGNANIILGNYAESLKFFSQAQHLFENVEKNDTESEKDWQKLSEVLGLCFQSKVITAKHCNIILSRLQFIKG
jgi:hypothetical protein